MQHLAALQQVSNMRGFPVAAPSDELAAAWTINNGTDLEMGYGAPPPTARSECSDGMAAPISVLRDATRRHRSTVWTDHLENAVRLGLVSEATVTQALRRNLRQVRSAQPAWQACTVWTARHSNGTAMAQHTNGAFRSGATVRQCRQCEVSRELRCTCEYSGA